MSSTNRTVHKKHLWDKYGLPIIGKDGQQNEAESRMVEKLLQWEKSNCRHCGEVKPSVDEE